ncbi:MAG: PAS domain S-box protein [Desulfobacteraceae bacterium]|nr:PAS domain S-box protein [Desulfobacteraceae bacterium]
MGKKPTYKELEKKIAQLEKEAALRRQEDQEMRLLQFCINHSLDEILWINSEAQLMYVNDAACKALRYSRKELLSMKIGHIDPDFKLENWETRLAELHDVKSHRFETRHRSKDGQIFPVEVVSNFMIFEGQKGCLSIVRDITDRKKAEQAIKDSEAKFRELAEMLPETIFELDLKGRLTFVNKKAFDLFGYTANDFSKGINVIDFVVETDQEKALSNIGRILRGEALGFTEYEVKKKDGTIFIAKFHSSAIIKKGVPVGIRGFLIDVTQEKHIQEILTQSEKRYRRLFEKSKDAILIIRDQNFIDCNQATVDMLGYNTKEQLLLTHPSSLSPPVQPDGKDSYTKANEMMAEAIKNGSHRFEWLHTRSNGSVFPVEVLLTTIPCESGGYEIHTIWRDITERKQAETALHESERHLRAILESNPDPMVVYNLKGYPQYLNPAFTKIFGWNLEELKGAKIPFVPENQKKRSSDLLHQLYSDGNPVSFETERLTKKNRVLDIIVSAAVDKDDNGEPIGMVVNLTDVTSQKKLEMQYKQAQKMEAIGTLAGGIAHDFNNILSGMFGYSQLAQRDIEHPDKVKKHLAQIVKGAKRSANLVQQILTFSRQSEYQKMSLGLHLVVKESIMLLRPSIPATIEIKTDITSKAVVHADPTKMHQLIINLCTNAYHAMSESGGILSISLSEVEISNFKNLKGKKVYPGNYIKLEVTDTGYGMDEKVLDKAFDPYFTTKQIGKGTGFGLSLVHAIVEEHKGILEVHSEPEKGSSFYIFLPIIDKKIHSHNGAKNKNTKIEGTESIMVVDDEEDIRLITKELLENYGYHVYLYENGLDAYRDFVKNPRHFDLIVSDMTMPGMTGDKLASKMLNIRPNLPIILCTGFSENFSEEQAYDIGIKKFFYKPISNTDLVHSMRNILDNI